MYTKCENENKIATVERKYLPFIVRIGGVGVRVAVVIFAWCNFGIPSTQRTFVWTEQFQ